MGTIRAPPHWLRVCVSAPVYTDPWSMIRWKEERREGTELDHNLDPIHHTLKREKKQKERVAKASKKPI